MAFLFTAGLSSYKAVDNFQANFANLKERKNVIDKALEEEENSKAMAKKADQITTVENAATKLRRLRFEIAKAFNAYADVQKVNMKDVDISNEVADSWDKYFETKGQTKFSKKKTKLLKQAISRWKKNRVRNQIRKNLNLKMKNRYLVGVYRQLTVTIMERKREKLWH